MKVIMIEEATLDRLFDDFAKEVDLAKYETLDFVPHDKLLERSALSDAHRKWVYHFRTLQQRIRSER